MGMFIYGYSDQQYNPKDVYGMSNIVAKGPNGVNTILPQQYSRKLRVDNVLSA